MKTSSTTHNTENEQDLFSGMGKVAINSIYKLIWSVDKALESPNKVPIVQRPKDIVVHVVDPNTGEKRDFVLNQKVLMTRMKFFEKYTTHYMVNKFKKSQKGKIAPTIQNSKVGFY